MTATESLRQPPEGGQGDAAAADPTAAPAVALAGGTGPLLVLAFDHRSSLRRWLGERGVVPDIEQLRSAKRVVVQGLRHASQRLDAGERASVLLDDEYGSDALADAKAAGLPRVLAVERSGMPEFDFEHGDAFMEHVEEQAPEAVKALVRYNAEGDAAANQRSRRRLGLLASRLGPAGTALMIELLVPPTPGQLAIAGDEPSFDRRLRPALTVAAMRELADAGIRPVWWKVEGPEDDEAAETVGTAGQATSERGCLVLGRGADAGNVRRWLSRASGAAGFDGFAVGRTIWMDAIGRWLSGCADGRATAEAIGDRYLEMVAAYMSGKQE